jgi:hypothetical protein
MQVDGPIRDSSSVRSTIAVPRVASNPAHETAPADADAAWLNEARLQDTRRAVEEDTRVLASVLSLSRDQEVRIANQLEQLRLATEASSTTEYDAIVSVLTPEQQTAYEQHLERQRRIDAGHLAFLRTDAIERVTGPLSDLQRDQVYQAIAASLIKMEATAEADILKAVLDEKQFTLWSQSSVASPVQVDR